MFLAKASLKPLEMEDFECGNYLGRRSQLMPGGCRSVTFCNGITLMVGAVALIFVRDGIHSDADYNSTRVGVVVVVVIVVVVAIFTMG